MDFRSVIIMILVILGSALILTGDSDCSEQNTNRVRLNRTLFFTPEGELTPVAPVGFRIPVPSGMKEGMFGYGILPRDRAEYKEIGRFTTPPLQAQMNILDDMVVLVPMRADNSTYFDLRISLFLNDINFAPQQELNNELAEPEMDVWEVTFKTENKMVPKNGEFQVLVEVRTNLDGIVIISEGFNVFGIKFESDMIDINGFEIDRNSDLRFDFKECFDVALSEVYVSDIDIRKDYGWIRETMEDPVPVDTDGGFFVEDEIYLSSGSYTATINLRYNRESPYGSPSFYIEYEFEIEEEEEPDKPWLMTGEECLRDYTDGKGDTWDLSLYTMGRQTEGYMELERGTCASCDIISVHSCRVGSDLVVNVTFKGKVDDMTSCTLYMVNRSFMMEELKYELGWEEEDFPVVKPDMEFIMSTSILDDGDWWLCDGEETNGKVVTFRDDLDDLYYDDIDPEFELFVIAIRGDISMSSEVDAFLDWDYAGYNVVEPELVGEKRISVYAEKDTDETILERVFSEGKLVIVAISGSIILLAVVIVVVRMRKGRRSARYRG